MSKLDDEFKAIEDAIAGHVPAKQTVIDYVKAHKVVIIAGVVSLVIIWVYALS